MSSVNNPATYADHVFSSTHNSYSPGRGTLRQQLDSGVRFLELDVHLKLGDLVLGHIAPGHQVAVGNGNPEDLMLGTWLAAVGTWSAEHADHTPITVALDVKDDLVAPNSFAEGNLAALNQVVSDTFKERLFTSEQLADLEWPTLDELRGRVLWVLSGNARTRRGYVMDGGRNPSVALDDRGSVVEVHASRTGELWYWSGEHAGVHVTWRRHGRVGPGRSPAVALSDRGDVILLHGGGEYDVTCRIGRIDEHGEIGWGLPSRAALPQAAGDPAPEIRLLDDQTIRVTYETGYGRRACTGSLPGLDAGGPRRDIQWTERSERAEGGDAQFHPNHAIRSDRVVSVVAVPREEGDGEMLLYGTSRLSSAPIRYQQLGFAEVQWVPLVGARETVGDQRFVATKANEGPYETWAREWREQGRVVRLWEFGEEHIRNTVNPNFPATDEPTAPWYMSYLREKGALQ